MLDAKTIKENLSREDIIKIVNNLGGKLLEGTKYTEYMKFTTCCHNINGKGRYKLYYNPLKYSFRCFTECSESFDVFKLVEKNKSLHGISLPFPQSMYYVADLTGKHLSRNIILEKKNGLIDDWDFIENYHILEKEKVNLLKLHKTLIDFFPKIYHEDWINEGISIDTMEKFNIRYYINQNKIVIPHYDINENLIGIRGRSFNQDELDIGQKYMPIYIHDNCFKDENGIIEGFGHPLGLNLYGLHKTKNAIKKLRKAVIFEGEKSVMHCEDFYGEMNFTCASCGMSFSNYQRDLLLGLGIEEVIIAYDKCSEEKLTEYKKYIKRILAVCKKFVSYVRVYVIDDKLDLLEDKDAPCDKGKQILAILMKDKMELTMDDIYEIEKDLDS